MRQKFIPEEELVKKAEHLLFKNFGPVETVRFLSISKEKKIDSLARHQKWQEDLDKEEFFTKVFGKNK